MSKNITFAGDILIASGSHRQFLDNWGDLERYCGYREDNIPQLEDINRHISKSANQHISISANQHISKSANQLAHCTTWWHSQAGRVDPASPWVVIIFAYQVSSQQDRFPNPTSGWLSLAQVRNRREEKLNTLISSQGLPGRPCLQGLPLHSVREPVKNVLAEFVR